MDAHPTAAEALVRVCIAPYNRHMAKAQEHTDVKERFNDGAILQVRIWVVPTPVPPCRHSFKYSLFYGYPGVRLLSYDNERGKGDHRHNNGEETPYRFVTIEQLVEEFYAEVALLRGIDP